MLVEKLRNWEKVYPEDEDKPDGSLYYEAADRIEELERELREARLQELASLGQAQEAYEAQVALEEKLMNNKEAEILNDLIMGEGFDELVAYRLEKSLRWTMEDLTNADFDRHNLNELVDWLQYCRALVTVLEWFTTKDYSDTTKELNRIEDNLKGVYL